MSDPANRVACAELLNELKTSPLVEIVPATRESFEAGLGLFAMRADKGWSLTDCISFVVMKERNVKDALTGDRHFEQTGFAAILG